MSTKAERRDIYTTTRWRRMRNVVLEAHHYRCGRCGAGHMPLQIHHVHPVRDGGAAFPGPSGLIPLCERCHRGEHRGEHTETPEREQWQSLIDQERNTLNA